MGMIYKKLGKQLRIIINRGKYPMQIKQINAQSNAMITNPKEISKEFNNFFY